MPERPKLLFVAPWYLLPLDAGGKLRTADLLGHLNADHFSITLLSPEPTGDQPPATGLKDLCDRFVGWPAPPRSRLFPYTRLRHITSSLPIPVATDRNTKARQVIARELAISPDVVVTDFVHTDVLMPHTIAAPSVVFTHNVEAEILGRHSKTAQDMLRRFVWRNQYLKMMRFEKRALSRYDRVISVSPRDTAAFQRDYALNSVSEIETGLDLTRYPVKQDHKAVAPDAGELVFTASMNSAANIDAMSWFMDQVWPLLQKRRPNVKMSVVGRDPAKDLIARAQGLNWDFTGKVESIVPYVHQADLYVIPLRVGGGTRLKVVEAMALGAPVVSTPIGIEGLPVIPDTHYAHAAEAADMADAIDACLSSPGKRRALAKEALSLTQSHFCVRSVAQKFADICHEAINNAQR